MQNEKEKKWYKANGKKREKHEKNRRLEVNFNYQPDLNCEEESSREEDNKMKNKTDEWLC